MCRGLPANGLIHACGATAPPKAPAATLTQQAPPSPSAPQQQHPPDSRCQMWRGDTQVWRPSEETAMASSPPPGSSGAALSGCSVCARMELYRREGWGGGLHGKAPSGLGVNCGLASAATAAQLLSYHSHPTAHPHLRKGMRGTGYLDGSCRNSSGMPPATGPRPACPLCPGWLPPPAPLALAPPQCPGVPVPVPLGAVAPAAPSRLAGRRTGPTGPTRRRD